MKLLLLSIVSGICTFPIFLQDNITGDDPCPNKAVAAPVATIDSPTEIRFQDSPEGGRMSCAVFKAQDYCRAEVENFDFDARFSVLSANVYFTGGNFKSPAKGAITSSSLKPIKELMLQCVPGTIVLFEDIKVKGPDNKIRTLAGTSYRLY